jgi:hypothetical protein
MSSCLPPLSATSPNLLTLALILASPPTDPHPNPNPNSNPNPTQTQTQTLTFTLTFTFTFTLLTLVSAVKSRRLQTEVVLGEAHRKRLSATRKPASILTSAPVVFYQVFCHSPVQARGYRQLYHDLHVPFFILDKLNLYWIFNPVLDI